MARRKFFRTAHGATSGPDIVCWGDSLTAQGYPELLATTIPNTVRNAGVGGESSTTILARQGGDPFKLLPVGGSIPASGSVAVTIEYPAGQWPLIQGSGTPGSSFSGPLAGVQGTLSLAKAGAQYSHDAGDVYMFTRTMAGSSVSVASAQPFVTTFSEARRGDIAVIWAGRNNATQTDQVLQDIAAMIGHMTRTNKRYVVLGIIPSSDDTSTVLQQIAVLNQRLYETYGERYIDTLAFLQHEALSMAYVTPSAQDIQDIANGYTPSSLRQDTIHLNAAGRGTIANLIGRKLNTLGWVASFTPIASNSAAAAIWVSPTGNDTNAGTKGAPLMTLAAARDKVRTLTNNGANIPTGGVTVNVMAGVYSQPSTFVLSAADTGKSGSPIVWKAYGGEVNVTGSVTIPSSAYLTPSTAMQALFPTSVRSQVKMVDLAALGISYSAESSDRSAGTAMPTLVTVDGNVLTCARYPNHGWLSMEAGSTGGTITGSADDGSMKTVTPAVFKETDSTVLSWAGATGKAMVVAQPVFQWSTQYANITSINAANQTVTLDQASWWGTPDTTLGRYFIYNLPQALDSASEYYLDSDTGKLYFIPGARASVAHLNGPVIQLANLSHVRFEGINVREGRQCGIYAMNCSNISVTGAEVSAVNGGIIYETVTNSYVAESHVHHVGSIGVGVSGGDKPSLTPGNNVITDCEVDHFAMRLLSYAPGVSLYGVGHALLHSNIHDTPHEAVITWGCDHLVQDNWIHHAVNDNADAGAFYTGRDWTDQGNVLNRNLFSDIGTNDFRSSSQISIYFDDCSSGFKATNNIIVRGSRPFHHCGRDNYISNNVIVSSQDIAYYVGNWGSNANNQTTLKNRYNAVVTAPNYNTSAWSKYPHFSTILTDEPAIPKYNTISNCIIADTPAGVIESSSPVPQVTIQNNQVLSVDTLAFDTLTMVAARNSPIVAGKGSFQGIDITKIYGCSVTGMESTAPSTITNLAVAPEPGLFPLGWTGYGGAGIPFSNDQFAYTIETVSGMATAQVARATVQPTCVNPLEIACGQYETSMATVNESMTYFASMQVRPSVTCNMRLRFRFYNVTGTVATDIFGTYQTVSAGSTVTLSDSLTAPTGASTLAISAFTQETLAGGQYVDVTTCMVTEGATVYKFADGNTSGWTWNGTVGKSTSTGMPI